MPSIIPRFISITRNLKTGRTIPSILILVLTKLSQIRLLPFGKATSDFSHALIYKSSMVTSLEEIKL
mgnify:FL=1